MNKLRQKKESWYMRRRKQTTKDWLRFWVFSDMAFERLNPEE